MLPFFKSDGPQGLMGLFTNHRGPFSGYLQGYGHVLGNGFPV